MFVLSAYTVRFFYAAGKINTGGDLDMISNKEYTVHTVCMNMSLTIFKFILQQCSTVKQLKLLWDMKKD